MDCVRSRVVTVFEPVLVFEAAQYEVGTAMVQHAVQHEAETQADASCHSCLGLVVSDTKPGTRLREI